MAASPRFRDLLIYDHAAAFDEARDLQFAATTYVCPGHFAYVGFRGTDTTLTGWREDFNMAYRAPVEAQVLAARYLAAVAADSRFPETLLVGGHSKGGNLAEYAALTATPEVQQRIARLYNHDGPGFKAGLFAAADYEPLAGRMTKQVPADSMVGILMESFMPVEVVQATGRGFEQHSVFRWVVEGADGEAGRSNAEGARDTGEVRDAETARNVSGALKAFATLPELPERTQRRAGALARWLASLDGSECEAMVNALFAALKAAGITDASQLFEGGREWAILRDGVMGAPAEDRTIMLNALRGLTRAFSDVTAERNSARRDAQRKAKAE
nr:Mbeg1-like protein [Adlercreutzia equolifaciens]